MYLSGLRCELRRAVSAAARQHGSPGSNEKLSAMSGHSKFRDRQRVKCREYRSIPLAHERAIRKSVWWSRNYSPDYRVLM
jgi:hypothetical protein